jgi:ribulose-phosphate 3-epimerase
MEKEIVPALIAKSKKELYGMIDKVKDFVSILQLDIMDGKFVPNNSLDFDFKLPETNCKFEAHLMVENMLEWIKKFIDKADTIIAHFEACDNPKEIIDFVKKNNKRIAFAINPKTPLKEIEPYLDELDQVLIMTVDPGFYGSKFEPSALEKVKELRELKPDLDIEVDGSINDKTIKEANEAGANLFVSGSFIMKSGNEKEAIDKLRTFVK